MHQLANSSRVINVPEPIPVGHVRMLSPPPMEGKPDETPTGKSTGLPFPFSSPHSIRFIEPAAFAN
ncbi:hypothetical protein A6U96_18620 [Agrobacterium tumefaciens]|nr:hypothetical protein A6U96_18620 [Agrobacterium tumefaciens]